MPPNLKKTPVLVESKIGIASWSKAAAWGILAAAAAGTTGSMQGCTFLGFAAESYQQSASHEVKAEYAGLKDKSFAVVVTADRMIDSGHPGLVDRLTAKITERLSNPKNNPRPSGFVPAVKVLRYLYDNPSWPAKPMTELAAGLGGVQRLVYIEINEYRLNDPGNPYEWDGVASGNVSIIEVDGDSPEERPFEKVVSVSFPGKKGMGPNDYNMTTVTSALSLRFIDRATWLFYDHEEKVRPEY